MNNKPILFEDKMKYRDNEFLYDKCIKQHDCIMRYQWKMCEYKDKLKEIERLNNIINELEKYLRNEYSKFNGAIRIANVLDKLQELKEGE